MLDLKFIRENPKLVEKGAKNKGVEINIQKILKLDEECRKSSTSVQELREERNKAAREKNIEKGKKIKKDLEVKEKELKSKEDELQKLLLGIPNLPAKDVPIGDESKFKVIRNVGKSTKFDFTPKDHLEIGESLDIIDTHRASKVSGTRFGYLKNEGVLLEFALVNFVFEYLTKEGFIPIVPPVLLPQSITEKLGYWQGGGNEQYYLVYDPNEQHDSNERLYLAGTAEHAIVPMHKDETFNAKDLPKKYVGFSSSFRREAGTYGKDTRGIFRVHQFDKVEMIEFVKPEDDEKERRKLLSTVENLLQKLELPYRVVKLASQDLAFPTAETIDIEIWIPSQNRYRETHSISTTTDFQSRRLNIKYQERNEKKYVHILNGTAFAIGRTIIAILENYQQKDGSVLIPKILQKYIGKSIINPD